MLMQYWFPFRGCSPFWFVFGLKIEILESCWLQMLCFKRKMKENRLFAIFLCLYGLIFFWKRKKPSLLLLKRICAVGFLFSLQRIFFSLKALFLSQKEIFFFQKKSPADLRKCGFYRDSSQNPNFISAVSQTLYRIKEIFLFWFFWR